VTALKIKSAWFYISFAFALTACSGQIKNGERITKDPLILKDQEATSSQPLPWKMVRTPEAAALNDSGVEAVHDLRLDDAEKLFEDSIQKSPLYGLAYLNLARLYWVAEEENNSSKVFARLAVSGISYEDLLKTADRLYEYSRTRESVALLEQLSQIPQAGHLPSLRLGNYYLGQALYAQADAHFDRVLAKKPGNADALFARGFIRFQANDFERAASFLEAAKTNGSQEPQLCRLYLQSLFRTNKMEKAKTEQANCRGTDPDLAEIKIRILLVLNPFEDVSRIVAELKQEDAAALEMRVFGSNNRSALRQIQKELELGY